MSENPAQWGPATRIIHDVLRDARDQPFDVVGNSLEFRIARALANAGYLTEDDTWVTTSPPATPEPPPFKTATAVFTCAVTGCDWVRTCPSGDMAGGVEISFAFDAHERAEHMPGGAHMEITVREDEP